MSTPLLSIAIASANRGVAALISGCPLFIMNRPLKLQRFHLIAGSVNNATKTPPLPLSIATKTISQIGSSPKFSRSNIMSNSNLRSQFKAIMANTKTNCAGSNSLDNSLLSSGEPQTATSSGDDDIQRDYSEAIKDLNSLQSNNQVLALAKYKKPETILPLFSKHLQLAGIDIDELDGLNAIHISGTKGKGSTCAFLESILLSMGPLLDDGDNKRRRLKVGSYNSPHLVHVTERIRINGKPIERSVFAKYFRHVFDKLKSATELEQLAMPSYFAFLTILAFHIFIQEKVDCAIIEVGIGGEYDPTNIIRKPVACAITTLDLDHTNILGKTIKSIAWTKAGITKPGVPMFTVEHEQNEATETIRHRALQIGSPVYICKLLNFNKQIQLGIHGRAQAINAAVACQLALYLLQYLRLPLEEVPNFDNMMLDRYGEQMIELETNIESLPEPFKKGLERSKLPGRCQIIECSNAIFFLDGAHTKKSMENCLEWFVQASSKLEQDSDSLKMLLVNIIGERNKSEVLKPLVPHYKQFNKIIFTSNRVYPVNMSQDSIDSETFVRMQNTNYEKGFENVINNASVWTELVREYETITDSMPQQILKPSIMEAILEILGDLDTVPSTINKIGINKSVKKPHVLATGSLHFVGAILETIEMLDSGKYVK